MNDFLTKERLLLFLEKFGKRFHSETTIYLTGGATALLKNWRNTTLDIDLYANPEPSQLFQNISDLKQDLQINIEIAAPIHFVPTLSGWENRSEFIERFGKTNYYHFDFYSQVFAKLSRGHTRDLKDVENMYRENLVNPSRLLELFEAAQDQIIKFPALSSKTLSETIHHWCSTHD